MYENKINNRSKRRPNIRIKAHVILDGYAGRATYSYAKAEDMLIKLNDDGIFKQLTIPVYAKNSDFMNDSTKKGTRVVGFIEGIELESEDATYPTASVSLYPACEDMLDRVGDNITMTIRAYVKNSEIVRINQFTLDCGESNSEESSSEE